MMKKISLTFFVLATLWTGSMAQSSSCANTLITLSPCLNYITGNSSTPTSSCCTPLASVVKSSPECLCEAINSGGSSLGVNINKTHAMELPSACNIQTPPLSSCTASSPSGSPTGGISGSDGSMATPSIETSNGEVLKMSISLVLVVLVVLAESFTRYFIDM